MRRSDASNSPFKLQKMGYSTSLEHYPLNNCKNQKHDAECNTYPIKATNSIVLER